MMALVKSEVPALPPRSPVRYLPSRMTPRHAAWIASLQEWGAEGYGGCAQDGVNAHEEGCRSHTHTTTCARRPRAHSRLSHPSRSSPLHAQPHVAQHHDAAQQHRSGVGLVLARNVGRGAVHRLEHGRRLANVAADGRVARWRREVE